MLLLGAPRDIEVESIDNGERDCTGGRRRLKEMLIPLHVDLLGRVGHFVSIHIAFSRSILLLVGRALGFGLEMLNIH